MNVMIIDGGGRGHALAEKLNESTDVHNLYIAPGNAGTEAIGENIPIDTSDIKQLKRFAHQNADLTIIGGETPLGLGIVDAFDEEGLQIFGPTKDAAKIETSKKFAKKIMEMKDIQTPHHKRFSRRKNVLKYVEDRPFPQVIKADGPARARGVEVCETLEQVEIFTEYLKSIGHLGKGQSVLIEDYVEGAEMSLHAFSDGKTYKMFPFAAQDHKRRDEGGNGPMTGGMGVVAPLPGYSAMQIEKLGEKVVAPILKTLRARGAAFKGVLFPGIKGGNVLEYNARFGDPEAQVYLRLLKSDLLPIVLSCIEESLDKQPDPQWRKGAAACIVLAAKGYPKKFQTGAIIEGLDDAAAVTGVHILHASTKRHRDHMVTDGGRVINVVGEGEDLPSALENAYLAADKIRFDGKRPQMRRDIGSQASAT